jgi:hypothetical protein
MYLKKLHGVNYQKTVSSCVPNQMAPYPRSEQVPIYQVTLRYIPENCYLPNYTVPHPTRQKVLSIKLQGVIFQKTADIYLQTTRRHIP